MHMQTVYAFDSTQFKTSSSAQCAVWSCRWIQSWATLVTAVSAYPASKSHLILDFIDYPDKAGLKWQANNGLPGSGRLSALSSHCALQHLAMKLAAQTLCTVATATIHCCMSHDE